MPGSTRVRRQLRAPREKVYAAIIDKVAVQTWMVPDGMTSEVHVFEPHEGGSFRISLTYEKATGMGKTSAQTDTYHGRFVKLVPNELVVQAMEFETDDPNMKGEMTVTYALLQANDDTQLLVSHEGVPPGILPWENEQGWTMSINKLAKLVEGTR